MGGHDILGFGTLKKELMKWVDFVHADTNLRKLKVILIIIGCT